MPGYNHYLNCSCGWCVKNFRGSFRPREWENFFEDFAAREFLRRHHADKGRAAYFIDPNASCPVCKASVFYYQNRYGSRVFFDELGHPWPKHDCTHRESAPSEWPTSSASPTLRPRGLVAEIVEAASRTNQYRGHEIRADGFSPKWTLVQVISVLRSGFRSKIIGRLLEIEGDTRIFFTFESADEVVFENDLVSVQKYQMSIFNNVKNKPKYYNIVIYSDSDFLL